MTELGNHVIRGEDADVWLRFSDAKELESYLLTQLYGLKGVYLSPRRDLCTGTLSFLLRLSRPYELEGARVYIEGEEIEDFPWGALHEIPGGRVEIRIEHPDYKPIIKHLDLEADDAGEQRLTLSSEDLVPA